jgi:hypothetical protein
MRFLKTGFAVAAIMLGTSALTSPAFATGGGCGYGGCGQQGGDTNNYYDNDTYNNQTYNKGGTGIGVGIGKGGNASVNDSGNSYNNIDNKNWNSNSNSNYNKNENNNHNYNSNSNYNSNRNELKNTNYNSDYNSNKQSQGQHQGQAQGQGQAQEVSDSGNSSVSINNERPPVSTAYAAPLAAGEDTCMGSSSIGGQGVGFGLTLGTTWTDDNCRRLKNSRQLVSLGYHRAATALMCVDEDVKAAMVAAGTPCPGTQQAAVVAPVVYAETAAPAYVPMAPIADEPVRKRRVKKALPPK